MEDYDVAIEPKWSEVRGAQQRIDRGEASMERKFHLLPKVTKPVGKQPPWRCDLVQAGVDAREAATEFLRPALHPTRLLADRCPSVDQDPCHRPEATGAPNLPRRLPRRCRR